MRGRRDRSQYLRQAGNLQYERVLSVLGRRTEASYQVLAVWLVDSVFHRFVDEFGIWRRLPQRCREDC